MTAEDEMGGWNYRLSDMSLSMSELWELVMDREALCAAVHGGHSSPTGLSDSVELCCVLISLQLSCTASLVKLP